MFIVNIVAKVSGSFSSRFPDFSQDFGEDLEGSITGISDNFNKYQGKWAKIA